MLKKFSAVLAALLIIPHAALHAESAADPAQLQRDIAALRAEMGNAAQSLSDDLLALLPDIPGLSCEPYFLEVTAPPNVSLSCHYAEHDFAFSLIVDPSAKAESICELVTAARQADEAGQTRPNFFRFFQSDPWSLMRDDDSLMGCYGSSVALIALVPSVTDITAELDKIAESVLLRDPGEILIIDKAARYFALRDRLVDLLQEQGVLLARIIPVPAGGSFKLEEFLTKEALFDELGFSAARVVEGLPLAWGKLDIDACQLKIELSAGRDDVQRVRDRMSRWGFADRSDGEVFRRHSIWNRPRAIGSEALDGTSIDLLLDNSVSANIKIASFDEACADQPDIIHQIIDGLLIHDLSVFGPLPEATQ